MLRRAPHRTHSKPRPDLIPKLSDDAKAQLLATLTQKFLNRRWYDGSSHHKNSPSTLVSDFKYTRKSTSTICPSHLDIDTLNDWILIALDKLAFSKISGDELPKFIWFFDGKNYYEARLASNDQYHGYPITEGEVPQVWERYEEN